MTTFQLSTEEVEVLREALSSYLGDLRVEISHTDARQMREALKSQETILKAILERLGNASR